MAEKLDIPRWRALAEGLCAFRCGVNTPENTLLFQRLCRELPFTIHEYAAGSQFNGWIVPSRWHVEKAEIRRDGKVLFDGRAHALGVAALSRSFSGTLTRDELADHLVSNPRLPEAHMFHCLWQYRPWAADWAFSAPWSAIQNWGPGRYEVELITRDTPDPMQVAEYTHPGASSQTFVFQAHTCHPGQAEDGFGAVALLVRLFQSLRGRNTRFSYKLLLGPEHLGTIFWLRDKSREELERLCGGCFMEMPGVDAPIKAASSYLGGQYIDMAVRHALLQEKASHVSVPWRCGAGNDETVWEAAGYEVPFVELTRCQSQFTPFPTYHSNLDRVDDMDTRRVSEMYKVLQSCLYVLENNARVTRRFNGLICLSHPDYNLYMARPEPTINPEVDDENEKWGHMLDSLFRDLDGQVSLTEMAEKYALPFAALHAYLKQWEAKELVCFRPPAVNRPFISRIGEEAC